MYFANIYQKVCMLKNVFDLVQWQQIKIKLNYIILKLTCQTNMCAEECVSCHPCYSSLVSPVTMASVMLLSFIS